MASRRDVTCILKHQKSVENANKSFKAMHRSQTDQRHHKPFISWRKVSMIKGQTTIKKATTSTT
jgi:hypothetical protein